MMESADRKPLLVFDLRNGRVGGMTFCRIVESWFRPEQSWVIHNDVHEAVEHWFALPDERRRDIRFIWGHNFSRFRKEVGLERPLRIVGLVRHPLLKVSVMDVRSPGWLETLDGMSLQFEFDEYRREGGALPCGSVEVFLAGHFVLGVTELMEESLLLLRTKLGLDAPLPPWERLGARPHVDDNIYSHGRVSAFTKRPQYSREIGWYSQARHRLADDIRQLGRRPLAELARYKAECGGRDPTVLKWATAYPEIFAPVAPAWCWKRPRRPNWLRPAPTPSRIQFEGTHWMVILGQGEAELPGSPPEREVLAPILTLRLAHMGVASAPNLLRIELALPPIDQPERWIYGLMGEHRLFQIEVGPAAAVHVFEAPISPRLDRVTLVINQYRLVEGRRLYGQLHLQALRAPLQGSP